MWELGLIAEMAATYAQRRQQREAQSTLDLYAQLSGLHSARGINMYQTWISGQSSRLASIVECAYCGRERHAMLRTERCEGCGAQEVR